MSRKQKHEEHLNHEAWAIPYADLITLLLAFFVVMYAISSVNEGKYRVLSDAMVSAFNGAPTGRNVLPIAQKDAAATGEGTPAAINLPLLSNLGHAAIAPLSSKSGQDSASVGHHAEPSASASAAATDGAETALTRVANAVEHAMHDLVARNLVAVRRSNSTVEVEIRTDILFPSGSATLAPTAIDILTRLAESLRSVPNPIRVEGHTDDRPISTVTFPSNWELSAARASSVVHLFSSRNIEPARLAVIGLSEYRPVKTNATPEGRNANRRVVIVILSPDSAKDSAPVSAVQPVTPVAATITPPCRQWHGSCTT